MKIMLIKTPALLQIPNEIQIKTSEMNLQLQKKHKTSSSRTVLV